jgi:hypothetical protein
MNARRIPARHGALWLLGGFSLFRRHPPLMTAITFGYLLIVITVNLVPKIGPFLLPLLLPTLTVMLANGCRMVERGKPLATEALIDGISERRVGLIRLGGLHLLGSSVLVLVGSALSGPIDISEGVDLNDASALLTDLGILLLLASPLLMAFWFAPMLTAWDGITAGKSLFFSFIASCRNWRAFALYGAALVVVGALLPGLILILAGLISTALIEILSVVLRLLLIFVLAPTVVASCYLSYRDVFKTPPATNE